jgi:hypothetical protein
MADLIFDQKIIVQKQAKLFVGRLLAAGFTPDEIRSTLELFREYAELQISDDP